MNDAKQFIQKSESRGSLAMAEYELMTSGRSNRPGAPQVFIKLPIDWVLNCMGMHGKLLTQVCLRDNTHCLLTVQRTMLCGNSLCYTTKPLVGKTLAHGFTKLHCCVTNVSCGPGSVLTTSLVTESPLPPSPQCWLLRSLSWCVATTAAAMKEQCTLGLHENWS